MMSNSKPTENSDSSYMSSILVCRLLKAMQPARTLLRWTDDLHKIFVEAVEYQGGPYEAKPTAVKKRMEAMGVTSLTIWNIKSHLQKYRGKCDIGVGAKPSKTAHNMSETETVMDSDAAMNPTDLEVVNCLLMDDTEMVDSAFSADELQMMENELMNAIQA